MTKTGSTQMLLHVPSWFILTSSLKFICFKLAMGNREKQYYPDNDLYRIKMANKYAEPIYF